MAAYLVTWTQLEEWDAVKPCREDVWKALQMLEPNVPTTLTSRQLVRWPNIPGNGPGRPAYRFRTKPNRFSNYYARKHWNNGWQQWNARYGALRVSVFSHV